MKKTISNSLILQDKIGMFFKNKHSSYWIIAKIILVLLGSLGTIYTALSFFELPNSPLLIVSFCFILTIIFAIIYKSAFLIRYVIPSMILIFFGLLYKFVDVLMQGYFIIANSFLASIKLKDIYIREEYLKINLYDHSHYVTVFVMFILFILISVISYTIFYKNNFLLAFLFTFPFVEIGLFYGKIPDQLALLAIISFWIALFIMNISMKNYKSTIDLSNFIKKRARNKNSYYYTCESSNNISIKLGFTSLVICFVTFLTIYFGVSLIGYEKPANYNIIRKNIKLFASDISYDNIIDKLNNLPFNFDSIATKTVGGTNGGKLGEVDSIDFSNSVALEIEIPYITSTLYLKGYVGGDYTGHSWDQISSDDYKKNSELFDSFDQSDILPLNLNYSFFNLISSSHFFMNSPQEINIKNVGASNKYIYAPYNALYEESKIMTPFQDSFCKANRYTSYSIDFYNYSSDVWNNHFIDNSSQYYFDKDEKDSLQQLYDLNSLYESFASDFYTELPNNSLSKLKSDFNISNYHEYSNSELISIVKNYLASTAVYDLSPGKTPKDTDFVEYFLYENKKGYCSHFATAGALILRSLGIPARFVEGYIVTPDLLEVNISDPNFESKTYKVDVLDNYAHAWVEVYVEGIGWLPFEMTPGFSSSSVNPLNLAEDDSSLAITTPLVTTKPPVTTTNKVTTTTTSNIDSSSLFEVSESSQTASLSFTKEFILVIGIFFISLIIIMLLKRMLILHHRQKMFNNTDNDIVIKSLYKYFIKLLSFFEIQKFNTEGYFEFAEKIASAFPYINNDDITDFIEITLKLNLSSHNINDDERTKALSFIESFSEKLYVELSALKKLEMKFINNLK